MNFGFSDEQNLLRQEVRKFLEERSPLGEVRRFAEEPLGYSKGLWSELSALGWTGLVIPEELGGAGLGWVDLVVLLEETGRSLFPSPLISSVLATTAILELGSEETHRQWIPALADGRLIGALAIFDDGSDLRPQAITLRGKLDGDEILLEGSKSQVVDVDRADLFVVGFRDESDESVLALVEAGRAGLVAEAVPCIDPSKRLGILRFDGVRISPSAILAAGRAAESAIQQILDRGAVAVTAEMIGAGEAALDLTVQYAKDRAQFGSPIGRYQGVKHPLAEIYVDLESMKSLLYYAAWALDDCPEESSHAASKAKAFASEAFSRIGVDGVQLHGAVGYTEEYDIQLYLKRSKWARPMFGDENHHLDRVALLGGL